MTEKNKISPVLPHLEDAKLTLENGVAVLTFDRHDR